MSNLLEQQRQGVITRQLAAWAAILAVPTAIAGIYGMNFENMPELKTQYGYFVVIGIIALLCGVLYLRLSALDGSEPASIGAEKRALFGINGHSQGPAVSGLPPLNSRLGQQPSADRPA